MKASYGQKGFTIMEVLVTVLLISIAIPSMIYVQKGSWFGTSFSNRMGAASQLIEKKIQELKQTFPPVSSTSPVEENNVSLTWTVNAIPVSIAVNDDVREVVLKAYWKAQTGNDSLQVTTFIAKDY